MGPSFKTFVESKHGTPQLEKVGEMGSISAYLLIQSPSPRYLSSFSLPPLGISPASVPLPSVSLQLQSPSPRYLSSCKSPSPRYLSSFSLPPLGISPASVSLPSVSLQCKLAAVVAHHECGTVAPPRPRAGHQKRANADNSTPPMPQPGRLADPSAPPPSPPATGGGRRRGAAASA
jgi:hypothetical protein